MTSRAHARYGMKVAFLVRSTAMRYRGGEYAQAVGIAEALRPLGIHVEIANGPGPEAERADVVHLFNITQPEETLALAWWAKARGKPIALTPIYQDLSEYDERGRGGPLGWLFKVIRRPSHREVLRSALRTLTNPSHLLWSRASPFGNVRRMQAQVLGLADVLLPNSEMEMARIREHFGLNTDHQVVYCAPQRVFDRPSPRGFETRYPCREFVVCVGQLIPLKNQLALLRALRGTGITAVMIGGAVVGHRGYRRRLEREARGNPAVVILPPMEPPELASAYAAAKVVVLPSWFETCGIVCLEGALGGCNVVVTTRGYTREYFKDFAWYCNPDSPDSIRAAVVNAFESPPRSEFREYILQRYTWEGAAACVAEAYRRVLRADPIGVRPPA